MLSPGGWRWGADGGLQVVADFLPGHVGAAEEFVGGRAAGADGEAGGVEERGELVHRGEFGGELVDAVLRGQAQGGAQRGEALVGVVGAQVQADARRGW